MPEKEKLPPWAVEQMARDAASAAPAEAVERIWNRIRDAIEADPGQEGTRE